MSLSLDRSLLKPVATVVAIVLSLFQIYFTGGFGVTDAHILRGITLEMPDGQHVGIIGSSGSGKSMLSLAIMGLLPEGARVEGSMRWGDRELVGASERELRSLRGSQISMMLQDPATSLDPLMRLGKQIALPLRRHRGLRGTALREAIERALDFAAGFASTVCGMEGSWGHGAPISE